MALNYGKKFEKKFAYDFQKTVVGSTIDRLYDQVSGYKTICNISDFIGYIYPTIMYLECKSHQGNTFPFTALRQYDDLIKKMDIHGVRTGVVLWMIDHDKVVYIPIKSVKQMKEDGCKSFNIKMLDEKKYRIIEIPSVKKRVFMDSDYSVMTKLEDGD